MLYLSEPYRKLHHPSLSVLILFSPHLPIGMLVFWFTTFMFSDLCTHRPSPGYALWHSPAKSYKTNFDITRSQRIKMPLLRDIFPSPSFHLFSHLYSKVECYYFLYSILFSTFEGLTRKRLARLQHFPGNLIY